MLQNVLKNFRGARRCLPLMAAMLILPQAMTFSANAEAVNTSSSSVKPGLLSGKTWFLGIGYSPSSVRFTHSQTIPDGRVASLNSDTKVSNNEISLRLVKEFLSEERFSFSLLASGAYLTGTSEDQVRGLGYTQRLDGYQVGGGASLNVNFYGMGFGIQPFIAAEVFSESSTFELEYSSNDNPVLITNKVNTVVLQPSVGVRVFDPHTSIMSYLTVASASNLNSTVNSQLDVNNDGAEGFANPELIEAANLMVRLGFGVFF